MPSLKTTIIALLATTATAMPAWPRLTARQLNYHTVARRQNDAAKKLGLNDFDILQL